MISLRWMLAAVLCAACISTYPAACMAEVAALFSIHRHGARAALPKNAYLDDNAAFGGPELLPEGQEQCNAVGASFRARYVDQATCGETSTCLLRWTPSGSTNGDEFGALNTPGAGFNGFNTRMQSSHLARTLQSAMAFASGVFPAASREANNHTVCGNSRSLGFVAQLGGYEFTTHQYSSMHME